MSDIEQLTKITSILQDISIQQPPSDAIEAKLPPGNDDLPVSDYDSKVFQLIQLIDEYEKLVNDGYRLNFINGFLNLSRANYGHNTRKYGSSSFDLRPYKSCKQVSFVEDEFVMIDILKQKRADTDESTKKQLDTKTSKLSDWLKSQEKQLQIIDRKKEQNKYQNLDQKVDQMKNQKINLVDHVSEICREDPYPETSVGVTTGSSKFTSTVEKHSSDTTEDVIDLELPLKDPLHQFGSLVPYQLRQSKFYFENSLDCIIKVLNYHIKINKLITEIESFEDKLRKDEEIASETLLKEKTADKNSSIELIDDSSKEPISN